MAREIVRVTTIEDLLPERMLCVVIDGLPIALAHVDGVLYAFSDTCRHEGGPLSAGVLIDHTVTCPWHGWTYDIRTGKSIVPPISLYIPTYPVHLVDGDVYVEIDWD